MFRSRLAVAAGLVLVPICGLSVAYAQAAPARPVVTDIGTYRLLDQPQPGAARPEMSATPGRVWHDVHYGPSGRQRLDLYVPPRSIDPGPWPTIVWLHSGGWISGTKNQTDPIVQRELGRGYAVASVDYALAPAHPFPEPLGDVKLAIRWIKAIGGRYGLDAKTVVLAGGSSGGYLAAMAAATPGRFEPADIPRALQGADDGVAGVVDFVGPTDFVTFDREASGTAVGTYARSLGAAFLGCREPTPCPPGVEQRASIAPYVTRAAPPIFIAVGATDALVPPLTQALPLATRWAAVTGPNRVWLQIVPREGHNLGLGDVNLGALDRFLAAVART